MDGREGEVSFSLRFKLSLWLSLAIIATAAGAGLFSFVAALDEAHAVQDKQLGQTAFLISRLDAVPAAPLARERAGDHDFDARVVVRFLTGEGGSAADQPARAPFFSPALGDGLQSVLVGGEHWRVFVKTNAKGVRVAVAQQTRVRDAAARKSALRTLMPILLLVPLLVLLVNALVRAMFKPMRRLSDAVERRTEHDLGQLDAGGLPSEVRPFVAKINQLLERTARALTLQRRFIADAAHEMRSPLTAMSLQAERLAGTAMPDEARARLAALSAGLARTRELLDQLLALARTQDPASRPAERLDLNLALRTVLEDLVPLAEDKDIDLGVIGAVDAALEAHPVDLHMLIKNVLDNAIRYTPPGGKVDITLSRRAGLVLLQVDDTGPGIAPAERERVFDPFYRVLGNGELGSGLGLAITRTVADAMGARIRLSDRAPLPGLRVLVTFAPAA
jgi:two-component system OmpR family sensor kinase